MVDFRPQVVDHEWFCVVVLIIGEGHGLEVEGHHGAALDIAKLVLASGRVGVSVEELGHRGPVLGEVRVLSARVPFLVEVEHVVGLGSEQLVQLLVLKDCVKNPDFIDGWFSTFISDSSECDQREECEMDLPDECLVEHEEAEGGVGDQGSGPSVVGSVQPGEYLVGVVSGSLSPFLEVVSEEVVAPVELVWVSLGFALYSHYYDTMYNKRTSSCPSGAWMLAQ